MNKLSFIVIFSFFGIINATYSYNDQKENCSGMVTGSFCYNGPKFDQYGQYKSCVVPGVMAITFDDGPSIYTSHILDVLKQYNMKATFNIKITNIKSFHAVVQRMGDEGHQISSHTYSHTWLTSVRDVAKEMLDFETALLNEKFTGVLSNQIPNYMRAPHGAVNQTVMNILKQLGYVAIHWGFLTDDTTTNQPNPMDVYYGHLGGQFGYRVDTQTLSVITQQHDTQLITNDNFANLAQYLNRTFGSKGLRFVTIAECLGNNPPALRPYLRTDPTCSRGIRSNNTCCLSSCGTCGGVGCSLREGGAQGCCDTDIQKVNRSCQLSPAPCVIQTEPHDPTCTHGIRSNNVCCMASCGICGGTGCSLRVGGANGCCGANILKTNHSCQESVAPCVIPPEPREIVIDPTCSHGIKSKNICCLASCVTCGGNGCSSRVGGADGCCASDIQINNQSCQISPPPCIIYTS